MDATCYWRHFVEYVLFMAVVGGGFLAGFFFLVGWLVGFFGVFLLSKGNVKTIITSP